MFFILNKMNEWCLVGVVSNGLGGRGLVLGVRHHVFVFECHSFIFVLLYLPHFYTLIVVNVVLYHHRVINHDVVHKSKRHPRLHKTIQVSSSGTGKITIPELSEFIL